MDWGNYLFSFQGRINRAKIWLFVLVAIGAEIAYFIVMWALVGAAGMSMLTGMASDAGSMAGGVMGILALILSLAFFVVFIWAGLAVAVKRLHDRDKAGWWLLVFYGVPLVFDILAVIVSPPGTNAEPSAIGTIFLLAGFAIIIWFFVELYCLRGTVGDNRFGPDPLAGHAIPAQAA